MILSMPESVAFLAAKGQTERVRATVRRLRPELALSDETDVNPIEHTKKHNAPIAKIFQDGRTFGTVTLWVLFFMSFYSILTMVAWSTNLVASAGFTQPQASGVLGWSYGWGRIGAMSGPLIGGLIVAMKWEVVSFYIALGVPAAIAAFATLFLTRLAKAASVGSSEVLRPGLSASNQAFWHASSINFGSIFRAKKFNTQRTL